MLSENEPEASQEQIEKRNSWRALLNDEDFKMEKLLYQKRLGGLEFCGDIGINDFFSGDIGKPRRECMYPTSKMLIEYVGAGKNTARFYYKTLKVMQVTPDGFIIEKPNGDLNSNTIYIYKTNESEIVDGSYLDEQTNWDRYQYIGVYTYKTLIGSKTIHAFKKIPKETFEKALIGLKLYSSSKEYFIKNSLWDYVEELEKK